ncbi:MAG: alpha-L-rhamnosidase, partial [Armatimonadetes bacterium]|nr:alpha-L-rhamnosidase [Armatimonadota bacterium]
LVIETGPEPLTLEKLTLRETRYPLEMESQFSASDKRLERVIPIAVRGLQMCSHETYMDCPFYEQLMYVGDTRLEALTTYVLTRDARLPRKALRLFDESRIANGLTQSRYPANAAQIIPPFSLWWVAMVHDHAMWRGDEKFILSRMIGVRSVMEAFQSFRDRDGLVVAPPGWNFMDWVPNWVQGIPPEGVAGTSALINWQYALVLRQAAELEDWAGEPALAERHREQACQLAQKLTEVFWDEGRGLFADDRSGKFFSEHTQCLALLSGWLTPDKKASVERALMNDRTLERTTIYFTHYLFETYRQMGAIKPLFERLGLWFELEKQGSKTTVEMPEPTRSDCHAWGAHPLYHYYASLLGIRPASWGFDTVRIEPQPGPLKSISASMVHPRGAIEVSLQKRKKGWVASVRLPRGVKGEFSFQGMTVPLDKNSSNLSFR